MAKIKFDVSGSDPDKARGGVFDPPTPGVYTAKIKEINPGYSKGSDGKQDKKRPRLEVIYEIVEGKFKGAPLWDYLSFSEAAQWKLDQFLQAVGVASKKKRTGTIDTDDLVGRVVKIRVAKDTNQDGEYRPKVGTIMEAKDLDLDDDEDEDALEDAEDLDDDDEDEDEEDEDEEDEGEEEGDGYDEMEVSDLRKELKKRGLETKGAKPALIDRLREADAESEDEDDDGEDPF